MKLWTHHPDKFKVDDPDLMIDHTKGGYWHHEEKGFRYRDVLPVLVKRIGTDQFLWCCTVRGEFERVSEDVDLVEWELDIEYSQILAFYNVPIWDDLVSSRNDEWENLVLDTGEADQNVGALVRVPLGPTTATRIGPLEVKYPKRNQ